MSHSAPDDRLPNEDEAVAAGQADGGAHRVVPAGHQTPMQGGLRHLTPGQLVTLVTSGQQSSPDNLTRGEGR